MCQARHVMEKGSGLAAGLLDQRGNLGLPFGPRMGETMRHPWRGSYWAHIRTYRKASEKGPLGTVCCAISSLSLRSSPNKCANSLANDVHPRQPRPRLADIWWKLDEGRNSQPETKAKQ